MTKKPPIYQLHLISKSGRLIPMPLYGRPPGIWTKLARYRGASAYQALTDGTDRETRKLFVLREVKRQI